MKREVVLLLLPEGVSREDVTLPQRSWAGVVWFEADKIHQHHDPGELLGRALKKAAKSIAAAVEEGA